MVIRCRCDLSRSGLPLLLRFFIVSDIIFLHLEAGESFFFRKYHDVCIFKPILNTFRRRRIYYTLCHPLRHLPSAICQKLIFFLNFIMIYDVWSSSSKYMERKK